MALGQRHEKEEILTNDLKLHSNEKYAHTIYKK